MFIVLALLRTDFKTPTRLPACFFSPSVHISIRLMTSGRHKFNQTLFQTMAWGRLKELKQISRLSQWYNVTFLLSPANCRVLDSCSSKRSHKDDGISSKRPVDQVRVHLFDIDLLGTRPQTWLQPEGGVRVCGRGLTAQRRWQRWLLLRNSGGLNRLWLQTGTVSLMMLHLSNTCSFYARDFKETSVKTYLCERNCHFKESWRARSCDQIAAESKRCVPPSLFFVHLFNNNASLTCEMCVSVCSWGSVVPIRGAAEAFCGQTTMRRTFRLNGEEMCFWRQQLSATIHFYGQCKPQRSRANRILSLTQALQTRLRGSLCEKDDYLSRFS